MKKNILIFILSVLLFSSCEETKQTSNDTNHLIAVIPNIEVLKDSIQLNGNEGNWYYKNELFNGYSVRYYPNSTLQQKVGFLNGKKVGVAKIWHPNGVLKVQSHYNKNTLVGLYQSWWDNGNLASKSFYKNGKIDGVSKEWYPNGVLSKSRNLSEGQEVGMQQAWLKNGTLYVNYEAKNGRIFGMRRANSCYKLENEVVISSKN
ncbi:hypothetical protein [Croceitalea sp. P059]|uniref:toxin-antitoxin system YwqK family antitoxin n=1 Tax=Croceitalea sp. P059 TaxID=3075601 RepID=UPI00288683EB|nr:hypothetical protein [Croceitalea sp. P059]MDT0539406.1 hypothetical protein [Croceitalea sp. P059]